MLRYPLFVPALVLLPTLASAQIGTAGVVHIDATTENVKYLFGPAAPVARVEPGQIIEANTLDAFGDVLRKRGDTLPMVKGDNPLTGPFYVETAEPGDTLVVKVLDVQIDADQGVGAIGPGFGALNATTYTAMLHDPLPERIWFYPVDKTTNTARFTAHDSSFSVAIPILPFLGCLGVAPPLGESRASLTPGEWGGNMDSPQVSAGHTVYLPVNVPGALLFFGDGHAAQGDGEIGGTGIEIPMRVRLQVDVLKGYKIAWPRFENDRSIMALGAVRPLDDALRVAFTELVGWIETDYGLSKMDAYELLTKAARIHLNEMVDPNYVVVASIDKHFLPPRRPQAVERRP
jgi:amidase